MRNFWKTLFGSILGGFFGTLFAFGAIFLGFFILAVALSSGSRSKSQEKQSLSENSVLFYEIKGELPDLGEESFLGMNSINNFHDFKESMSKAARDKKIKAMILKVSSVSDLGWARAKELKEVISDFKSNDKKVYAYADYLDEKGLYIASSASKILMSRIGEVEWNGIAMVPMFYKKLLGDLKVKPLIFKAGKFKSAIEPLIRENMSPENRQQSEELIEDLWEEAVEEVAKSRNVEAAELMALAEDLSVRTSLDAKKFSLIDEISTFTFLQEGLLKEKDKELEEKDLKRIVSLNEYVQLKNKGLLSSFKNSIFSKKNNSKNKIAVLVLDGSIMPGPSGDGVIGSDSVIQEIQKLRLDKKVKGLILRVNSPGGSALASDIIWTELEKFKAQKPFYVSMANVAASGGYYISAGAHKIFAHENTITGSIGVFSVLLNIKETMNQKLGLTFDSVLSNKYADLGSAVRSMTEEEKSFFQSSVERIYTVFLKVVGEGRKFTQRSDVEAVAQGRVWTGNQAKEVGLVDEVGGLEEASLAMAEELKLEDYDLDYYPKSEAFEALIVRLGRLSHLGLKLEKSLKSPLPLLQERLEKSYYNKPLMLLPYELNAH